MNPAQEYRIEALKIEVYEQGFGISYYAYGDDEEKQ